MSKKVFFLMVLLQIGTFVFMLGNKERISSIGREYRVAITGLDPYDFMRGNYLRLQMVDPYIYTDITINKNSKVYLELDSESKDFEVLNVLDTIPKHSDYIVVDGLRGSGDRYYMGDVFGRYYVESSKAKELEDRLRKSDRAYIIIRVYRGSYVVEDISID